MNVIQIDTLEDIAIALELIMEAKETLNALVMDLKPEQRFTAPLLWGGVVRDVEIKRAYCSASYNGGRWICHALNEHEGYYVENHEFLNGTFLHSNKDTRVVHDALVRFFASEDFTIHRPDSLTGTVIPACAIIPDRQV